MNPEHRGNDLDELLKHAGWIRNLAYASLRDFALAEDVSQEVLLKALAEPRKSGQVLRAWLAAVTRNLSKNEIRKISRRRTREAKFTRAMEAEAVGISGAMEAAQADGDPSQDEVIQAQLALTRALETLAAPSRQLIVLRFYEDDSFQEIARKLKINVGAARVRLHRALQELRRAMQLRGGDWQANCALVLPLALRKSAYKSPLAAKLPTWVPGRSVATLGGVVGLTVAILWTVLGWLGESEPAPLSIPTLAEAELASVEFGTTPVPAELQRQKLGSKPTGEAGAVDPDLFEKCDGRVFYNGMPVKGAEIKAWQKGKFFTTTTDAEGYFELQLAAKTYACVTARARGLGCMSEWWPVERKILRMNLLDLPEDPISVTVYDGRNEQPLPGAYARVYVNWSGEYFLGAVRENALELVIEGTTDAQGKLAIPGWLDGLQIATSAEASGLRANFAESNQVVLYPGADLPVQLVYPNGNPVAEVEARLGYLVPEIVKTDQNGYLPAVSDWNACNFVPGIQAIPSCIILNLPDGRIWLFQGDDDPYQPIEVRSDRIRITVVDTPIEVELADFPLPDGAWIEARCWLDFQPGLFPTDPNAGWQRLEVGEVTKLSNGLADRSAEVTARIMPGGGVIGGYRPNNGRVVVGGTIAHLRVTLQGGVVDEGQELVLVLANNLGGNQKLEIPMVDGIAEADVPEANNCLAWFEKRPSGEMLLIEDPYKSYNTYFTLTFEDGRSEMQVRALDAQRRSVLIRVEGVPVIGGSADRLSIDLNGIGKLFFDGQGKPLFVSAELELPGELHHRNGGPILSAMSFRKTSEIPGSFHANSSGQMIWDLKLASVELYVPPASDPNMQRSLWDANAIIRDRLSWPPAAKYAWFKHLQVPAAGGWLSFRVPAGRYAFRIGKSTSYGDQAGVLFPPGKVTSLYPNPSTIKIND
jgi:RNA polymerase sigma factor (sigma-70 family)